MLPASEQRGVVNKVFNLAGFEYKYNQYFLNSKLLVTERGSFSFKECYYRFGCKMPITTFLAFVVSAGYSLF